jgi:hypothetical protein
MLDISGSIGFLDSMSVLVTGVWGLLKVKAAWALNSLMTLWLLSVGDIPRPDKSIRSNTGVGGISCCVLLLVLVIAGDCLGVVCLLKGLTGPNPDIHEYLGVCTGVGDAGGLSSSALSNCSWLLWWGLSVVWVWVHCQSFLVL